MTEKHLLKVFAAASLLVMVPIAAKADTTDYNMTLTRIGVQSGSAYMFFASPPSQTCNFGAIYIDLSTDSGKAMYSLALTAKVSKTPFYRIAYSVANGYCTATLIEF